MLHLITGTPSVRTRLRSGIECLWGKRFLNVAGGGGYFGGSCFGVVGVAWDDIVDTVMNQLFFLVFFILGIFVQASFAAVGGSTVWTATVTTTTRDPSTSSEACEIPLVGDDGVVVAKVQERLFEIVPQSVGSPIVRTVSLEGYPLARVGGRTIVLPNTDSANRRVQWIGEGGKLVSVPTQSGECAFAENGDCFTTSFLDQRVYLTRWTANGELVFRKALGRYIYSSGLVIGPEGRLFISMFGGTSSAKLFALNSEGEQLWSTSLGNEVRAPVPYRPTASGGVWTDESFGGGGWARLTEDGFAEIGLLGKSEFSVGFALSPTDEAIGEEFLSLSVYARCLLADGGSAYSYMPDGSASNVSGPSIIRLSSSGTVLWAKQVAPPYRGRVASRIGKGLAYCSAWIQTGENVFACHLSAIDLGAPPADSACPFYPVIWPDGSRRARPRSHAPPTVTMIAKPRHSGAVIEFGVEDGLDYSVESANKPEGPWRTVGTVPGVGYGARFTDPTSVGDAMRLYRVQRSR